MSDIRSWKEKLSISYQSVLDFFSSIKKTGSGTLSHKMPLNAAEMKKLISEWQAKKPDGIELTYYVYFVAAQNLRCSQIKYL